MPLCFSTVNLIPTTPIVEERPFHAPDGGIGVAVGKSRKRVFPQPHTQEPNPIFEAYGYCNIPNRTEQAWEGETCTVTQKNPNLMLCVIVSLVMWETYSWGRLSLCMSHKLIWWTAQKMLNLVIMSALVCQRTRDVLFLETSLLLDCIICNAAAPSHYSTALFLAWGNHTNILHCLRWVTQATANLLRGSFCHRRKINHVPHLDLLDHLS